MSARPLDCKPGTDPCAACTARASGLCGCLGTEGRSRLMASGYRMHYDEGDEIALQDEPNERVGILASGLVKTVVMMENGDEHLLQVVPTGQFVTDPNLRRTGYGVEAISGVEICWIPRAAWLEFLRETPEHYQAVLDTMAAQFEETRQNVVKMRGRTTTERLALWLLEQIPNAQAGQKAPAPVIGIVLTRRDLASLLDMTVETLCRALHLLDTQDAIRLLAPDVVEVIDVDRLRHAAKCTEERVQATIARPAYRGQDSHVPTARPPRSDATHAPDHWGDGAERLYARPNARPGDRRQ